MNVNLNPLSAADNEFEEDESSFLGCFFLLVVIFLVSAVKIAETLTPFFSLEEDEVDKKRVDDFVCSFEVKNVVGV